MTGAGGAGRRAANLAWAVLGVLLVGMTIDMYGNLLGGAGAWLDVAGIALVAVVATTIAVRTDRRDRPDADPGPAVGSGPAGGPGPAVDPDPDGR